jgi:hypothetical protein
VSDGEPLQGPLPDLPTKSVDQGTKMIAVAVEDVRSSVDDLRDDIGRFVKEMRESLKAIALVKDGQTSESAKSLTAITQQTAKVEQLIEVFAAFLTLTAEADKSTQKRVRLMMRVLERYTTRHDKQEAKRKPMSTTTIALLALGSGLAIIGLVAVIGWVFQ